MYASTTGGASWSLVAELPSRAPYRMTTTANGRLFMFSCNGLDATATNALAELYWIDDVTTHAPDATYGAADPLPSFDVSTALGAPCVGQLGNSVSGPWFVLGSGEWSIARRGLDDPSAPVNTVRVVYPTLTAGASSLMVAELAVRFSPECEKKPVPASCVSVISSHTVSPLEAGWTMAKPGFIETNRLAFSADTPFADTALLHWYELSPAGSTIASRYQLVVGDAWSATRSFAMTGANAKGEVAFAGGWLGEYDNGAFYSDVGGVSLQYARAWPTTGAAGRVLETNTVVVTP